jgi:hypothetical protein
MPKASRQHYATADAAFLELTPVGPPITWDNNKLRAG